MAALTITTGALRGQRVECDQPLVIGREGVDVVIDDVEMSRQHAALTPIAGGLEIEDLGSLNGTFVNGRRISGKVKLEHDAEVKLGTTCFTVDLPPADAPIGNVSGATIMSPIVTPAPRVPATPAPDETPDETVIRELPAPKVSDAGAVTDQPVELVAETTVVRPSPVVDDPDKTVLRAQPLVSPQEPTIVRDVIKGIPGARQPASGPPSDQSAATPGEPSRSRPLVPLILLVLVVCVVAVVVAKLLL